ncbi:MAG: CBS domain-containing protein [Candidatus Rokubacteria bacterium]|nr:CBS domain-containing protein [Candidatus Rokubacteria bacterium]
MSDTMDEYGETQERDLREIRGALFDDTLAVLTPPEPITVPETATVRDAVAAMVTRRQAGVLVVDPAGRLVGIFTERDVLLRVIGKGLDPAATHVGRVMTADPEALRITDRVAHALHSMAVAGYRTIPIVEADGRPIGVVTATDVIRWLGDLFPEAVLNLAPGDTIKHPEQMDAG